MIRNGGYGKRILLLLLFVLMSQLIHAAILNGYVVDRQSGEPLIYCAVIIRGTNLGLYTNKKGYFIFNDVPTGEVEIVAQLMGYRPLRETHEITSADEEYYLKLEMDREGIEMPEMVIEGDREEIEINTRDIRVSNIMRRTEDIKDVVALAEADVFRSVMQLPGVAPISDYSSGLYVRGGSPDQNLILLDDIDVYNPNHFGGVFSTFNTDAVKNVELLKGGFPARYGGRLSSVLDVTNKDGNRRYHEGIARLSLISTSATVEGPWNIEMQEGSYMASFRRTYLDILKELAGLEMPDYYFYDGHLKLNWDISPEDKFSVSTYFGQDNLELDYGSKILMQWGNETFSTQWTHIFNPQLFSHFVFAGSQFYSKFRVESDADQYFKRENDIRDLTVKSMFTWKPVSEHQIDFGFESKFNTVLFEGGSNSDVNEDHMPNVEVDAAIVALYAQDSWELDEWWTLQPGLRFTWCSTKSLYGDDKPNASYMRLAPRISLRRILSDYANAYVAYGRYNQYLSLLSFGESTPMDLWFPIDDSVEPGQSDHYIGGVKFNIDQEFTIDLEGYYKEYDNLLEYRPETDYEWDNNTGVLADVVNMGDGYSYGGEILIRNDWKGLRGFVGYSYGITKRKMDTVNTDPETGEPVSYYPKYDRTHQINIVEAYNYSEYTGEQLWGGDLKFNLTFNYSTGQPYAKPEHVYWDGEQFKFLYSYKDAYRLEPYVRLDLGFAIRWDYTSWSIEPYFQTINVLNNDNVWNVAYSADFDEEGNVSIEEEETLMLPFIPFVGVNVEW